MQLTESICLRAALLVIGMAVIGGGPEVSAQNENVCTRTIQVWRAIEAVSGEGCARLTLHHLREITTLDLRNQSISSLSASDFDGLVRLETLDLSGNVLTSLPSGVFDELYLLKTLRLNGNLLQTLPDGIFDSLLLLKELTLHENRFTSLPDGLFEELSLFDGMQADGSQPDNSGPYPRIQRFLDRHAVSSPEEFIAALPTSYLQRFVLMYRSESPAAPRLREQADPPSTADRLPPRRGDRPSSKTYFAAGRRVSHASAACGAGSSAPPGRWSRSPARSPCPPRPRPRTLLGSLTCQSRLSFGCPLRSWFIPKLIPDLAIAPSQLRLVEWPSASALEQTQ